MLQVPNFACQFERVVFLDIAYRVLSTTERIEDFSGGKGGALVACPGFLQRIGPVVTSSNFITFRQHLMASTCQLQKSQPRITACSNLSTR